MPSEANNESLREDVLSLLQSLDPTGGGVGLHCLQPAIDVLRAETLRIVFRRVMRQPGAWPQEAALKALRSALEVEAVLTSLYGRPWGANGATPSPQTESAAPSTPRLMGAAGPEGIALKGDESAARSKP